MAGSFFNKAHKKKTSAFKPSPQYIKAGDVVVFSQGDTNVETRVLDLSEERILLENISQKFIAGKPATLFNAGRTMPWKISVPKVRRLKEKSDYYLSCENPKKLVLLNRRNNFRVAVPKTKPYRIQFEINGTKVSTGFIDLSATGAQIELPQNVSDGLSATDVIEQATIVIEDVFDRCLGFTVMWKDCGSTACRYGIAFSDISEAERSALMKLIYQFERELI